MWLPLFVVLIVLGALCWAKAKDPFRRHWLTLTPADAPATRAVVVLPKPVRAMPVIFYVQDKSAKMLEGGMEMRQLAEMGLAVIGVEYDYETAGVFDTQFNEALRYVNRQTWAGPGRVWIGEGRGAAMLLQFAQRYPALKPELMMQLGVETQANHLAAGIDRSWGQTQLDFYHAGEDTVVPAREVQRLVHLLQQKGIKADVGVSAGQQRDFGLSRAALFRMLGERCVTFLQGPDALKEYHSVALWKHEANGLWFFLTPAFAWAFISAWTLRKKEKGEVVPRSTFEKALRWAAVVILVLAIAQTAIHSVPRRLLVADWSLKVAERSLIHPKWKEDFVELHRQPYWKEQKLETLLTHVELAHYNRELINWRVDDTLYREFVLSPILSPDDRELDWRRELWESFYPRIRKEKTIAAAADTVVRHLRERVTVSSETFPNGVSTIWRNQIADENGFRRICVAAFRSVGIAARFGASGEAEFWDGDHWQRAPEPMKLQFQPADSALVHSY